MIIQLYIEGTRVDLFKDESVTITDSIQNVKDIDKIFTAFSQSFSIPASKTNNKIFQHYYNFDIVGGFDGRKKVSAIIELNNVPFKTGKVKLEGVDMKNNKPHTYRITFFGDTIELKDTLGEKKLSDLSLSAYNTAYDETTVETKLITGESSTNHIVAPLITHSQRLFYDSVEHINGNGNLYYHTGSGNNLHGVKWNELKYALRVNKIIEAIEADFDLEFSTHFFKNTSIEEFDHLFLWLHRKSGTVEDLAGSTSTFETIIDGWTPTTITQAGTTYSFVLTETTLTTDIPTFGTTSSSATQSGLGIFEVQLTTTDPDAYDVVLQRDGVTVFSKTGHIGDITISADPTDTYNFNYAAGSYKVIITAQSQISFTNIIWNATYYIAKKADLIINASNGGATGAYNTNLSFTFNISQQIPDMKVIDFLTGIFKLFNLTAYVEDEVIQVMPLNQFYALQTQYDITEYVDVNSSKIDNALPFKEVSFKFKDTKTFLANKFSELNNRDWGSLFYNEGQNLSSGTYKIEAPFGHMLFERLIDVATGTTQNIQWGYNVDSNQSPYLGSPLLFYPINLGIGTAGLSFVDAVNGNNEPTSHKKLTTVNHPSNSPSFVPSSNPSQLNFNREVNEWTQSIDYTDSLFEDRYKDYIESVFDSSQRLIKIKAYLPLKILLNYKMNDTFIIHDDQYRINSISTNLLTGESNIELLRRI